MLEKLQRFLKNLHKFDKKLPLQDQIEKFDSEYKHLINAIKEDNVEKIKIAMRELIMEIIKYANVKEINLSELLNEGFNI